MIDITGQRFGLLVVLSRGENISGRTAWLCACDCGNKKLVSTNHLRRKQIKSCGCLWRKHGCASNGKETPEYFCWNGMVSRCSDPNNKDYKNYGGRGIKVCERWRESFQNFLSDMGKRPSPKHTLDRWPNQNGNYEPSNCRWATRTQQARNRRSTTLSPEIVQEIRRLRAQGLSYARIAKAVNRGFSAVRSVIDGRTWRNTPATDVPVILRVQ